MGGGGSGGDTTAALTTSTASTNVANAPHKGRERAIEQLIDMDSRGGYFRTVRIMDESPPSALLARPNRITTPSLVDSAHALKEYEVDYNAYVSSITPSSSDKEAEETKQEESSKTKETLSPSTPSLTKSGRLFSTPSASSTPLPPSFGDEDNESAELEIRNRVFRHYAKIIMAKDSFSSSSSTSVTPATPSVDVAMKGGGGISSSSSAPTASIAVPPPQLVATLRKMYGSSSSKGKEEEEEKEGINHFLPLLLKSVLHHAVYTGHATTASNNNTTTIPLLDSTSIESLAAASSASLESSFKLSSQKDGLEEESSIPSPANVEKIIGNAVRLLLTSKEEDESLHGVLIAILSVLTEYMPSEKEEKGAVKGGTRSSSDIAQSYVLPTRLQVASILSLLTSPSTTTTTTTNVLSPELLSYFQAASSVYEERIELQKKSLLEKLEAEREADRKKRQLIALEAAKAVQVEEEEKEKLQQQQQQQQQQKEDQEKEEEAEAESEEKEGVATPSAATPSATTPSAVSPPVEEKEEETPSMSTSTIPPLPPTADLALSLLEATTETVRALASSMEGVADDDDDEEDEEDEEEDEENSEEEDSTTTIGYEEEEEDATNILASLHTDSQELEEEAEHILDSALLGGSSSSQVEIEDDDDDDDDEEDSSSSSSSSSSEEGNEPMLGEEEEEEEEESEVEEEDDEAAMLQRALALSLAEHNAAVAAAAAAAEEEENKEEKDEERETEEKEEEEEAVSATTTEDASNITTTETTTTTPGTTATVEEKEEETTMSAFNTPLPKTPSSSSQEEVEPMPQPSETHSSSSSSSSSDPEDVEDDQEEELNLPSIPTPPKSYPYSSFPQDDQEGGGKEGVFDPSSLSQFGSLPAAQVLLYLLQHATSVISSPRTGNAKKEECLTVLNGVGSSLFSPAVEAASTTTASPSSKTDADSTASSNSKEEKSKETKMTTTTTTTTHQLSSTSISFHLLISILHIITSLRNDSKSNLKSTLRELDSFASSSSTASKSLSSKQQRQQEAEEVAAEETPTEEADPLYSTPTKSSSSSTSDALEAKGMRRKAAAAKQVASLRLERIQKKIELWKTSLKLYSNCSFIVLKILRKFLEGEKMEGLKRLVREEKKREGLTGAVRKTLDLALKSFYGTKSGNGCKALLKALSSTSKEEGKSWKEVEEMMLPLQLAQEAIQVWGDVIPYLYPTQDEREEILKKLVCEVYPLDSSSSSSSSFSAKVKEFKNVPWTKTEENIIQLEMLSQRFCFSDMLDEFVSHPLCFHPFHDTASSEEEGEELIVQNQRKISGTSPRKPFMLLSLLGSVVEKIQLHSTKEELDKNALVKLYQALCHRANTRLFFWDDGLPLSSTDDLVTTSNTAAMLASNGDFRSVSNSNGGVAAAVDGLLVLNSNPSSFQFDSTRCSDSIAILSTTNSPNGISAHQRASKVWGTVLSSSFFMPKTGVHRWAVRLDKCERGHVFVGVATARASVKTYVGGDKFGWGVIGTQALWHDRSKIRGDYGSTFRTGAVIVVTLDTDSGTLSFGLWKDPNASSASSGGSSSDNGNAGVSTTQTMNLSSPLRRASSGSGAVMEDWGVAFEGLPLDAKLYPAVGLYQRDDRVTLLQASNKSRGIGDTELNGMMISSGESYYPCIPTSLTPKPHTTTTTTSDSSTISSGVLRNKIKENYRQWICDWNRSLSSEGISYAYEVLARSIKLLSSDTQSSLESSILLDSVLPSLASSLCLIPSSIPVLSSRYAMALLPLLTHCAKLVDKKILPEYRSCAPGGEIIKGGRWVIRATPSSSASGSSRSSNNDNNNSISSSECEEYVVNFAPVPIPDEMRGAGSGFHGEGIGTTGRSQNGHVSIIGSVRGTVLQFVEEWTDSGDAFAVPKGNTTSTTVSSSTSSCVIEARLSLDGTKFEGTYQNVQYGTTGSIAGVYCPNNNKSLVLSDADNPTSSPPVELSSGEKEANKQRALVQTECLLCYAASHLSFTLSSSTFHYDVHLRQNIIESGGLSSSTSIVNKKSDLGDEERIKREKSLAELLRTTSILSQGVGDPDGKNMRQVLELLMVGCSIPQASVFSNADYSNIVSDWKNSISKPLISEIKRDTCSAEKNSGQLELSDEIDSQFASQNGGFGSLSSLCSMEYSTARRKIVNMLLRHTGLLSAVICQYNNGEKQCNEDIGKVWKTALGIMENGVRLSLSNPRSGMSRRDACLEHCTVVSQISNFLLELPKAESNRSIDETLEEIQCVYRTISSKDDLDYIIQQMNSTTKRGILRYLGMASLHLLLRSPGHLSLNQKMDISTIAAQECAVVSLSQLMGRGISSIVLSENYHTPFFKTGQENKIQAQGDMGGHYLTNLYGCSNLVQSCIRNQAHLLYCHMGFTLSVLLKGKRNAALDDCNYSHLSLMLTVLANFITTIRPCDQINIIRESKILALLSSVVSKCRDALSEETLPCFPTSESGTAIIVEKLCKASQCHTSRHILRASVSVIHVICFRLSRQLSSTSGGTDGLQDIVAETLDLLQNEIRCIQPMVESRVLAQSKREEKMVAESEWDTWCEACIDNEVTREKIMFQRKDRKQRKTINLSGGSIGVFHLIEHGVISNGRASSISAASGLGTSSTNAEYISARLSYPVHYFTQLLNILFSLVRSELFRSTMSKHSSKWIEVMFNAIGLCCTYDEKDNSLTRIALNPEESHLPMRHRVRIFRLLRYLLVATDSELPIINGLLLIAGCGNVGDSISTPFCSKKSDRVIAGKSSEEKLSFSPMFLRDTNTLAKEAVSLLRRLYYPSDTANNWRGMLHVIMKEAFNEGSRCCLTQKQDELIMKQKGILAFIGGLPGRIVAGSYALLKPAAAASLSSPPLSSSKSHGSSSSSSSGGSTPHHVVGSGTEGIVTGLCRSDALAGIVSNIDVKSGMCEIIVLDRKIDSSLLLSSGGSSNMTVRAVRASLADVVSAEELPILIGADFPVEAAISLPLQEGIELLLGETKSSGNVCDSKENAKGHLNDGKTNEMKSMEDYDQNGNPKKSAPVNLATSLMALRSSIVALSDKRLLRKFVTMETCASQVLELATSLTGAGSSLSNTSSNESLSALPIHEARFWHLRSILLELQLRTSAFESLPLSHWEEITKTEEEKEEVERHEKGASTSSKTISREGYSTPPATVGSISGGEASATGAGTDEEGNESVSTADTHGQGQSSANATTAMSADEDDEAAETAAAHLREAAIAQMAELGLPRSWSELALRRTGGTNIEAAVHFCLERGGDMERLLAEERERERRMSSNSGGSGRRRGLGGGASNATANHLIRQLIEMGFPSHWCAEALAATRNNVDEALTWILTNGERLSAQDEGDEDDEAEDNDFGDDDDDESAEEDDEEDDEGNSSEKEGEQADKEKREDEKAEGDPSASYEEKTIVESETKKDDSDASEADNTLNKGWLGTVCPLRFVSGRSNINSSTLEVTGLPTGGFSSVGTKGVLLTTGKWYYEAEIHTAGCLQIGWADGSFAGHCQADRGDGCGDGPSSWAYDGWRRYRWHTTATEWGCRWKEGDVVGCMVDMDNKVISFTLNGQREEIGMGVAFSGLGFRPCGGVYACVSFNRKERIRLVLGGNCSRPFKYDPPTGYRGVGEAVLQSVKERDLLLDEEELLRTTPCTQSTDASKPSSAKKYICDFSDGEHGHELFAWQHRYYGSDASVHLGAGRSGSRGSGGNHRTTSGGGGSSKSAPVDAVSACLATHLNKAWTAEAKSLQESTDDPDIKSTLDAPTILSHLKRAHDRVTRQILSELHNVCLLLGMLYARKFVLHMIVTLPGEFDMRHISDIADAPSAEEKSKVALLASQRLWCVLENCASLHAAGWVGEAGAMAIAAEALGLGISSHDHGSGAGSVGGVGPARHGDDSVLLPAGGITQLLSTVLTTSGEKDNFQKDLVLQDTSASLAACAEAALGGEGGGSLVFLRPGLQSAAAKSVEFRRVLVVAVRSMVRLLAVVEFGNVDTTSDGNNAEDDEMEGNASTSNYDGQDEDVGGAEAADARLVSFLTGLLMSHATQSALSTQEKESIMVDLFEAWSIGLLSASAPWRMVCALTVSGILNLCPVSLVPALERIPTLNRFYARLESTVARRVWAERAAVPVCSRYVQALIELLGSVKRSLRLCSLAEITTPISYDDVSVDAATPLPMLMNGSTHSFENENRSNGSSLSCRSWEWDEGWISSDAGWEVWTGFVECMAVDWKTPSRSPVRTLMDGGEGPPMLREGCTVMRGLDWEESGSGSVSGDEDGKSLYEKEKAAREKEKQAIDENESKQAVAADPENKDDVEEGDHTGASNPSQPVEDDENPEKPPSPAPHEDDKNESREENSQNKQTGQKKKKKKKVPSPKLPIGTVLSIEPWNGMPAMGRRVRWNLTGKEAVYRYGGDGGRHDISHVEVNDKATRVRKRHPLPESAEQCAARYGFGTARKYNVLLRLRRHGSKDEVDASEIEFVHEGLLEWPDFGAGVRVDCRFHEDGAVTITEKELIFGSKDSGWEARFGQPSYVPGTIMVLSPTHPLSEEESDLDGHYEELLGSSSYLVKNLRNRSNGGRLRVTSEMRLVRGKHCSAKQRTQNESVPLPAIPAPLPPPICFDNGCHASSIALSRDKRTVTCITSDGRGTAFASVGFTKGVHYWEVKLEKADIGSVFVGVSEKPGSVSGSTSVSGGASSFGFDGQPRLNRWHGWGFVNFRATYTAGAERVYGAHCHAGDTVGVLLDCDAGRISYFFDGVKYGEHILNDLGCAFENVSPFGFNADGCGSGGAGQGAPSGIEGGRGGRYPANGAVRPRALWPVIGLRNPGDRVTISGKWMTGLGVDGVTVLRRSLAVDEILCKYEDQNYHFMKVNHEERVDVKEGISESSSNLFPKWFIHEAYLEYERWRSGRWLRSPTRGSGPHPLASFGLDVDLDISPLACAAASASLGMRYALLSGDRVAVKRSAGRMLELSEEAIVLGACQGRLFYRIASQKSEGGSLTEGGGRAWFWDESEVVDGGLQLIGEGKGLSVALPLLDRFKCTAKGGLKVVYTGGAVVRSDLEIFDGSANIGTIPHGAVINQKDVLERRMNSCGVIRFKVRYESVGEGWISNRIRGGKEEIIVEPVHSVEPSKTDENSDDEDPHVCCETPLDSARLWFKNYSQALTEQKQNHVLKEISSPPVSEGNQDWEVHNFSDFEKLLSSGVISGLSPIKSDSILASAVGAIADFAPSGDAVDCSFGEIASAISFATKNHIEGTHNETLLDAGIPDANQAAASVFSSLTMELPPIKALLARIAMLRALNRQARMILPWLSLRPAQEGSAILGGLSGFGASVERAGRNRQTKAMGMWVQAPSIATRIRSCREIIFPSVKQALLESMMNATATPTPLSHDEYELPREVRTVRVNRLKARRAMASDDTVLKRKHSVFFQLQHEMRGWSGAALRRGHVAKGHGGQKRAFKVKLVGEGVNDYSGPYREAFTDAMREVTELDQAGRGALGVLDPSPNNLADIGENRSLFVFATGDCSVSGDEPLLASQDRSDSVLTDDENIIRDEFSSFIMKKNESLRETEEALVFLGRLAGTACRHSIPVDLQLPLLMVWNRMVEERSDVKDSLSEIDLLACRHQEKNTRDVSSLLVGQQWLLNSFVEGMASVMPVEIFPIFTGRELQGIVCGNPDVDVDLLRRVVDYEGYEENDEVITFFWDVLREMTSQERKLFLQFVWARTRLPLKESDFEAPFKIQRDAKGDADSALPSASTCFFSLSLPQYSSREVLREKLLFAINNVCTMESDYVTNDAEVGEGWRGL